MNDGWLRLAPSWVRDRIGGRAQVQTILGNISWLSLDRVIRMGVGLVVGVWLARFLGPEQYGTLNFAAAFVALFSPLAMLGLDSIVVRDLVRSPRESGATLGTAFALKLAGGVISGIGAMLVIILTRPGQPLIHWLVIIAATGVLFQSLDTIDFWFQAKVRAKYVVYARNFAFLATAAVKVVLILLNASLIAFAWAGCAELALAAAGLLVLYGRVGESFGAWQARAARGLALLRDSWPLFLSGISIAIYMRIDQVMIGYMLDQAAVGTYSVAIRLVELWYFLPTAIAASVLPALIRARKEDATLYASRLQTFYDVMSSLSVVIAAVISLCATPIVSILYGPKYLSAGPILSVYAWATIPVFLAVASSQHFLVENLTRISMYRTFAGVIANVGLNVVLIPAWGPVGAAAASLISQSVVAFSIALFPGSRGQAVMLFRSLNPVRMIRHLLRR